MDDIEVIYYYENLYDVEVLSIDEDLYRHVFSNKYGKLVKIHFNVLKKAVMEEHNND